MAQFNTLETHITLSILFGTFLLLTLFASYMASFAFKTRLLKPLAFISIFVLLLGLMYNFIIVGKYGAMNHFIFQEANKLLELSVIRYVYFIIALFISALLSYILFKRTAKLLVVLKILLLTFIIIAIADAHRIYKKVKNHNAQSANQAIQSSDIVTYENELFSYAKNDKNIVIFVLDTFSNSHIPLIFEQFPALKNELDGFVFFPKTISNTTSTISSIATVIAGEYYTVINMNKRKQNLVSSITRAFGDIGLAFADNGYDVGYIATQHAFVDGSVQKMRDYTHDKVFIIDTFSNVFYPYYTQSVGLSDKISHIEAFIKNTDIASLLAFGLFRFSPEVFVRPRIYNDGLWFIGADKKLYSNAKISIAHSSTFYVATHILNTNAKKPTFKYIHTMMTHDPYGMYYTNGKCEFFERQTAWDDTPKSAIRAFNDKWEEEYSYQHFDTESCALDYLGTYIKKLKAAGIYDNTQIFVVGDHGGSDGIDIHRADALFLFKDFNSHGELKVDSRLMANYDIATIFCENLNGGCPNVGKNILKHYPNNREIIHSLPKSWMIEEHKSNEWLIKEAYKINEHNIFNRAEWIDISNEVANSKD